MRQEDLLPDTAAAETDVAAFPDTLRVGDLELRLDYHFLPGDERDGISIDVPLAARGRLDPDSLEWLVPGLLTEKLVCLIRGLPKSIRRSLVPAPDSARQAAALLGFGQRPFLPAVAEALSRVAGETIPVAALDLGKLPQHLRMHVRLLGDDGQVLAQGRDLEALRQALPPEEPAARGVIHDQAWKLDELTRWDFGELPTQLTIQRAGLHFTAYPALIDQGTTVAGRLLDDPDAARRATEQGVRRLV
jgi:ATP-dependent helicase HrpA